MNQKFVSLHNLVDNPTPRLPILFCVDASGSMSEVVDNFCTQYTNKDESFYEDGEKWTPAKGTTRLKLLRRALKGFFNTIKKDELTAYSAEVSIVTFNDHAECALDFTTLDSKTKVPKFTVCGDTNIGEGVNLALELLKKRELVYQSHGVDHYKPWLLIMSDGVNNGDSGEFEHAINRVRELASTGRLTVFPVGVGYAADLDALRKFSPEGVALTLEDGSIYDFFTWLSKKAINVSESLPGEIWDPDFDKIKDWTSL